MKKLITIANIAIIIFLSLITSDLHAQLRRNITSYSLSEKQELRDLIMEHVRTTNFDGTQTGVNKYGVVSHHTNHLAMVHGTQTSAFFTWHRYYLQELEHWLLERGKTKFLPLPAWNPSTTVGMAAFVPTVNNISILPAADGFAAVPNFPSGFNFATVTGTTKCSLTENGFNSFSHRAENQHNTVHGTMGGAMNAVNQSPGAAIFWPWHGWVDDLYFNYQKDCKNLQADLYINDNAADDGSVPNPEHVLWNSPDIWVRNTNDGFQAGNNNSQVLSQTPGAKGYVYVKVHNRGLRPNDNLVGQIKMYWAKASTGLSWPSPWDGAGTMTCGTNTLATGGEIGAQPLRRVNEDFVDFTHGGDIRQDYTIYEYEWLLPDPDKYQQCFTTNDEHKHFCLLARIEDDEVLNETVDFYANVKNNNNLAWRNITIMGDGVQSIAPPREWVTVGNYTDTEIYNDVTFEILFPTNKDLALLQVADLDLTLGDALVKMWNGKGNNIKQINQNEVRVAGNKATIEGFTFAPQEKSAMGVKINPKVASNETYTFDLIQYNEGKIIGGETYVVKPFAGPAACDCKSVESNFYQSNKGCDYTFGIKGMERCIEGVKWEITDENGNQNTNINNSINPNEINVTLTNGWNYITYVVYLTTGEKCKFELKVYADCCKYPRADETGHLESCIDQNEGIVILSSPYYIIWASIEGNVIVDNPASFGAPSIMVITNLNPGTYRYYVTPDISQKGCRYEITIAEDSCCSRVINNNLKVQKNTPNNTVKPKTGADVKILEVEEQRNLQVVPNPANEIVLLKYPASKVADRTIAIYTSEGKLVAQKSVVASDTSTEFDSSQLASGIFIAQLLEQGRIVQSAKVVIQH